MCRSPKRPIDLAIDFMLHDFEMTGKFISLPSLAVEMCSFTAENVRVGFTEVEPIPTYVDFGDSEFLVADERGYEHLVYEMAEAFLFTSDGKILDSRLKLNKVIKQTPSICYIKLSILIM